MQLLKKPWQYSQKLFHTWKKLYELKSDDIFALRSLKELYYRLKMTDKYNAVKAKLDTLEQQ